MVFCGGEGGDSGLLSLERFAACSFDLFNSMAGQRTELRSCCWAEEGSPAALPIRSALGEQEVVV